MLGPDGEDDASSAASGSVGGGDELKGPKKVSKGKKKKEATRRKTEADTKDFEATITEAKAATDVAIGSATASSPETQTKADQQKEAPPAKDAAASQAPSQASARPAAPRPAAAGPLLQEVEEGKGGGKKKKPARKQNWTDDQWSMVQVLMKVVMQMMQGMREVSGILFDVFLLPADSPLCALCTQQGKRYARATEGAGHGLGPPHIYVFAAVLTFLAEGDTATDVERQNLANWSQLSVEARCELVKLCKVAKLYDPSQRRAVLAFGPGPEAAALRGRVLEKLKQEKGYQFKLGKPPPGNLERQVGQFLDQIVG